MNRSGILNNEIAELSQEEIELIAGGVDIDSPAQDSLYTRASDGVDVPEIENNPPA